MERPRHLLAPAALLLLAAAFALPLPDAPLGDEATHLLAAASLWHDGDLRFDREDLARGYQTWSSGPRGVALVTATAGAGDAPGVPSAAPALVYGRPFLYPLVAAPVYGLLGPRGLRALNLALYLAMLWLAWRRFVPADGAIASTGHLGTPAVRGPRGRWAAGLVVAGLFFASGAAIRTLRFEPEVLLMACVFFAVALWCRVRSEPLWGWRELVPVAAAGVLLAAAAVSEPILALFALPPAVDLYWARRRRASAIFVLALIIAALILAGTQRRITGSWGPELAAEARAFVGPFPLEARPAVEQGDLGPPPWKLTEEAEPALEGPGREPAPRIASAPDAARARPPAGLRLRQAGWRLFWLGTGRHIGLLPYFPFALFVLGLYLADLRRPGGRSRHLLAGAFVVYLVAASLGVAGDFAAAAVPGAAGVSAAGARALALVCPVLLFLPRSLRGGRALLLPIVAAGLWTLPAVVVAASGLASDDLLELPARAPAYRVLPLELELLAAGRLPGHVAFARFPEAQGGLWLVPGQAFFVDERHPDGVWVLGATRSEVLVVAAGPVDAVRFTAKSLSDASELTVRGADGERLRARFDSEGKRAGVPVEVRPELIASGLGWFLRKRPEEERIYRFAIEVTGGAVPARIDTTSGDPRYLGVFLELPGDRL